MSKRVRQPKSLSGTIGFLAACLLALAMAIGFNWALLGDWSESFLASPRIPPQIQQIDSDDSSRDSKPLDANVRIKRLPGNFF
jgi:hypothetical protein